MTERLAPRDLISEKDLQQTIVDAARRLGWAVYHTHDSRKSTPGFPDLVMLRGERCLVFELKTARGRVKPEQTTWLELFNNAGINARIVRPKDLDDVLAELQEAA